jgi:Tol biopolymer transport system component
MYSGVDLVAPRGHPGADHLIWSRTNPNEILVSASEVGLGLELDGSQVFVLDIHTATKTMIAQTDRGIINGETWSPDNREIVLDFPSSTKGFENYKGLWIWDVQNTSFKFLTEKGRAIWSPTGKAIAVIESSEAGDLEILHLIDIDTGREIDLPIGETATIGHVWGGDWSPDGDRLILSVGNQRASIENNLFIYELKSHRLTGITDKGNNTLPAWSPQGSKIAYVKHVPGSNVDTLHLINPDGSCDVGFPYIDWILSLSWSPNGQKLAFIGPDGIYTLDIEEFLKSYGKSNGCF